MFKLTLASAMVALIPVACNPLCSSSNQGRGSVVGVGLDTARPDEPEFLAFFVEASVECDSTGWVFRGVIENLRSEVHHLTALRWVAGEEFDFVDEFTTDADPIDPVVTLLWPHDGSVPPCSESDRVAMMWSADFGNPGQACAMVGAQAVRAAQGTSCVPFPPTD